MEGKKKSEYNSGTPIKRVVNCLNAEKIALHGEFKAYWKDMAINIAVKNDIDINKVKENLELYNARSESSSFH
jgi:hypothetical protein